MRELEMFLRNLDSWVEDQRRALEIIRKYRESLESRDRLEMVLTLRFICQRMLKTVKGFDTWLHSPFIVGPMPLEVIREVREKLLNIMLRMLEISIKHVEEYRDYVEKMLQNKTILTVPEETGSEESYGESFEREARGETYRM